LLLTALYAAGLFTFLDRALYDHLLTSRVTGNPRPLNPQIIRVDLNDRAEHNLGERLDSREAFAALLSVLGDFDAQVAFDFIFRASTPYDGAFAAVSRRVEVLIQSVVPVEAEYENFSFGNLSAEELTILRKSLWHIKERGNARIPVARTFIMSNPEIAGAASQLAHIGIRADVDGVYRRTPLFFRWEDGLIPSLSLAIAVMELGVDPEEIELYPGNVLVLPLGEGEAIRIPVDSSASIIVPYTATWADDTYRISFDEVVRAGEDPDLYEKLMAELSQSMAVVADTTTTKRDFGIVPIETVYPLSGIHTAVISGILDEVFFREIPGNGKAVFILVLLVLVLCCGLFRKDAAYNLAFLFLFIAWTAVEYGLWIKGNVLPWYTLPAAGILCVWFLGIVCRLFFRYREQLLTREALIRYFPGSLAERIIAEGKAELKPVYKELTILFTDIAGFTKWSAGREPKDVHAFLSEYLGAMTNILFDYGGTVDKFMGDGILAFFGDQDLAGQKDPVDRCLNAAIAMQKKIGDLAEKWRPLVGIDLRVRMGINTGKVIVGDLGSKDRTEYTVIGSVVNLAQRMESSAVPGGILVTADTWEQAKDRFTFGEKKLITVKGYDQAVEAYEIAIP
jgi:adenylate cyclase